MAKSKKIILILLFLLFAGLISGYFFLSSILDKPLAPSLKEDLANQAVSTSNLIPNPGQDTPEPKEYSSPPSSQVPLCGNTPILTILVSGIDYPGDDYLYGLADVIRIVRIDFTKPEASIFTLDRDIWVEIPGIAEHYGITHGKLNEAYFYGVPAMGYYSGNAGGAGLLAQTLKWNFGLVVDNYVVVSMAAFVNAIDALGGIDVDLPQAMDGNYTSGENLGYFYAGPQHLDGTQALNLARIRAGYSSLIRISNQDAIIKGITEKVSSPAVILRIPQLLTVVRDTVLTDLTPSQINDLICLASKINKDDILFAEIPDSYYHPSTIFNPNFQKGVFIWDIDFNVIRDYVNEFQNGQLP